MYNLNALKNKNNTHRILIIYFNIIEIIKYSFSNFGAGEFGWMRMKHYVQASQLLYTV